MTVFSSADFDQHEQIDFVFDQESGLRAIIAVHNTYLGPALGGCRMHPYQSEQEAIRDVLRLSKGMTYKAAMAGVPLGGGKAVIIGDPRSDKSSQLFKAMGRFVDRQSGRYITAQDMGITADDLEQMATQTPYVSGVSRRDEPVKQVSRNPSPATAMGVFIGIEAAVRYQLKRDALEGIKVAIQGLGSVGYQLAGHLHRAGAKLWVSDINKEAEQRTALEFGATVVSAEELLRLQVDVFSPCAMGAVINDESVAVLGAKIVAGAANNQLMEVKHGIDLFNKGILYAPDYVINAGGIIDLYGFDQGRPEIETAERIKNIATTLEDIFVISARKQRATHSIANEQAEARFLHSSAGAT
ncbi:MAG: Glu/Leu/Phe/Val dehydrogenase [Rhizobiaceae bacterium]|nr:Glu/Leu/Phe/Val dehydrogenase [Rhizobiaceae bacterium]